MGHRSKTKSIKAKAPSSSKRVPAHHVAKSYHVPESATEIPKDSVNRRIVFRFDCVDLEADCPWSLAHMSDEEHRLLLLKMRDFEKATVGEIISPSYQAFTCYPDFTQCPNQTPQDRLAKYYEREAAAAASSRCFTAFSRESSSDDRLSKSDCLLSSSAFLLSYSSL